jgi:methyl-accepting chemotaxis protein
LQGIAALIGLCRIDSLTKDLTAHALPAAQAIAEMHGQIQYARRVELASLLCDDSACIAKYPPMRASAIQQYQAAKTKFESLTTDPEENTQFQAVNAAFNSYLTKSGAVMQAFAYANYTATAALKSQEQQLLGDFNSAFNKAQALSEKYTLECNRDSEQVNAKNVLLRWLAISVMLLILLLSGAVGFTLTRLIAFPIVEATAALEQVADKDLTVSIEARGEDETGRLATALNVTVASIRRVLQSVAKSADTLSAAAEELSVRSAQTSANTGTQTGKTDQIAAATEEMTATISEISQHAERAVTVSRQSALAAEKGGSVMKNAAEAMQEIAAATGTITDKMGSLARRSEEVGTVINVIQEISEQTNLLALNAAIEAARAGEHGRGFAVVAGEVRRLAERATGATREIAGTIRNIQSETRETLDLMSESRSTVESGLSKAANARASLTAIIESSKQVESMIHLIATAATEQTAASGEISKSAIQISQLATENAQAAHETADACRSLSSLASDLDKLIREFRTDADDGSLTGGKLMRVLPSRGSVPAYQAG